MTDNALTRRRFSQLGLASVLLGACSKGEEKAGKTGGTPGLVVLNRGNSAEPFSLDPALADGQWESDIVRDFLVGLFTEDAAAKPIPGMAERWEMSEDGLVWTFHLRDAVWSDGHPVTAEDFVFGWQRVLDPKTSSLYASILWDFKNAQAISAGKLDPSALGVRAVDAKTIELTLEHPAPYLIELLTHNMAYPVPKHIVEAKGKDWIKPENIACNGPYKLKEWISNDRITLVKNESFYDAAPVKIDVVNFYPTSDYQAALKRLRAGELDMQSRIPTDQIDWLRANMPEILQINSILSLFYLALNFERAPFHDIRLRKALNLALDRETIVDKILKLGELPAYGIVPPGTAGYPEGVTLGIEKTPLAQRRDQARALMAEMGYGPGKPFRTTLTTGTTTLYRRVAPVFQDMYRQVHIEIEILPLDLQIMYKKLDVGDFEIGTGAWIADYNDANNFLSILFHSKSEKNYGHYADPEFDAFSAKAQNERDAAARIALMVEAERVALADFACVPWKFNAANNLVRPYVKNWIPNVMEKNPTRWLSIDEAARAKVLG
jgi:oligopeptide transport system substrate-binding protein